MKLDQQQIEQWFYIGRIISDQDILTNQRKNCDVAI